MESRKTKHQEAIERMQKLQTESDDPIDRFNAKRGWGQLVPSKMPGDSNVVVQVQESKKTGCLKMLLIAVLSLMLISMLIGFLITGFTFSAIGVGIKRAVDHQNQIVRPSN